jgi:hypothetical protein
VKWATVLNGLRSVAIFDSFDCFANVTPRLRTGLYADTRFTGYFAIFPKNKKAAKAAFLFFAKYSN